MPTEKVLNFESEEIKYLCLKDKRLAKVISMVGPISYQTDRDPYTFLIHEIIEQMLSVKVGNVIYNRLNTLCGGKISVETIANLTDIEIKSIGTANSKVKYIRSITDTVLNNPGFFDELKFIPEKEAYQRLIQIRGIGPWTAKMYLIFVLNAPDILPYEDVAFLQSYKWLYKTSDTTPSSIKRKCKKWKPYSSIAVRYMYRALDMGYTRNEFHLYKGN